MNDATAGGGEKAYDLLRPVTERQFDLYALSLPRGPNFWSFTFRSGWKTADGHGVDAVLADRQSGAFGFLVLRRRVDHRFAVTAEAANLRSAEDALRTCPKSYLAV